MTLAIVLQFLVVLAAIWMGARSSGIGLGLWGAVGLMVLVAGFGINPTSPPIDVMLIILAVIMAASVMEAAGGIDFLVRIAERIIRANPKYVTIVAPLTTWTFTFVAGTGHIVYPLLPVIYETAHRSGIRPERPMAVATIASQQAITASPVAAATAAMIGLFAEKGMTQWGLPQILMVCVPATLTGVVAAAIVSMFVGKDLKDDPEYQARLAAGQIPAPQADTSRTPLKPGARLSAFIFLAGVALVVLFGFFPSLRQLPGAKSPLAMPIVIEILMMSVAAIMLLVTKVAVDEVPKTATLRAGVVAVIGIFGLAWLGDSFIAANKDVIVPAIGDWAKVAPWTFAFGLFLASVLLYSQAATTRALMPLGIALGIPPQFLIAMFPSVNGYFFIPTYGSLIAAINFDLSGTTKIGKYVLNHSFMIPGLVATSVAVFTGLAIARVIF
ncbi:MAG: anaerobic C4-dicarboxylate transporter [Comamonadaceae bacterium]|jgi:anaerobic C4-dicarboxylate transporter DcuA|uniref:anaerobic C4-dicarboxylate transporter family protein n=1 Tax=Candidatus Skiveiella danica TaxID=3386177 RepID=UPI001B620C91|nr:anaerobic C4-dicarboxylate transporter [Comamonadaceae bacterium]MBK9198705.1 anaerobic C4-dicarboxylate transporter [Betaproteobacteria bacterium]MBP8101226.1 anaerobic C4-dicarboxylate transporter [Burkholderiaceae bacterium]MBK7118080.1 anaerobic C4-dicarboxylate transporter [Comamonadaceae bacterium]MBK8360171.1 anaerobic C4-dicarboxylate transporter [Comamonadaceae bacterium]